MTEQKNPFLSSQEADDMIRSALADALKLAVLTMAIDPEVTQQNLAVVSVAIGRSLGSNLEDLDHLYAQMWTTALMVNAVVSEDANIPPDPGPHCGHDECTRQGHQQAAFVDAAVRGDLDRAMNVVRAVAKPDPADDEAAWRRVPKLQVGVISSIAAALLETHLGGQPADPESN